MGKDLILYNYVNKGGDGVRTERISHERKRGVWDEMHGACVCVCGGFGGKDVTCYSEGQK